MISIVIIKLLMSFCLMRLFVIIIIYYNHYRITLGFWLFYDGVAQKFVEKFSRELNTEYSGRGKHGTNITVQCVMPGYVATKMSKIARTSWLVPSPDTFVRSALQTTGLETITTGYLPHTLMVSYNIITCVSRTSMLLVVL